MLRREDEDPENGGFEAQLPQTIPTRPRLEDAENVYPSQRIQTPQATVFIAPIED